jgi:hypothetical protein
VDASRITLVVTANRRLAGEMRHLSGGVTVTAIIEAQTETAANALVQKAADPTTTASLDEGFKAKVNEANGTLPAAAGVAAISQPVVAAAASINAAPPAKKKEESSIGTPIIIACVVVGGLFAVGLAVKLRGKKSSLDQPVVDMNNQQALTRASLSHPDAYNDEHSV